MSGAFSARRWMVVLVVVWVAGCAGQREEDERVCAGRQCSGGMCVSDHGNPVCVCGAFEQAAHLSCVLLEQNNQLDAATLLPTDAGLVSETLGPDPSGSDLSWWFRFEAAPRTWYQIDTASDELDNLYLQLQEPPFTSGQAQLRVKATDGGTYHFTVRSDAHAAGHYTLGVHALGEDEAGEDSEHAAFLAPGAPLLGALQIPQDVDVYALSLTAGHAYRLDCAAPDGGLCPSQLWASDVYGTFPGKWNERRYFVAGKNGIDELWLQLYDYPWQEADPTAPPVASPYQIQLFDLGPDPTDPATAPTVPSDGGVISLGELPPGFPAAFTYETQEGDAYWAQLSGAGQCTASPGTHLGDDAGTATVMITAQDEGPCDLRVVDLGPDDVLADAPISPGAAFSGRLEWAGDVDKFVLQTSDDTTYQLTFDSADPLQVRYGQVSTSGWIARQSPATFIGDGYKWRLTVEYAGDLQPDHPIAYSIQVTSP